MKLMPESSDRPELHDFVELGRVERPYDPEGHFTALKEIGLYDPGRDMWINGLAVGQRGLERSDSPMRYTCHQLAAVLVESRFDRRAAERRFTTLQGSGFYEPALRQWLEENGFFLNSDKKTSLRDQLLAIVTQAAFDKTQALRAYHDLGYSFTYDSANGVWYRREEAVEITNSTETKLLDLLIRANIFGEAPGYPYARLKTQGYYDATNNLWLNKKLTRTDIIPSGTKRYLADQFLGLLIEARLDPEGARGQYEHLKTLYKYWPKENLWGWHIYQQSDGSWAQGETPNPYDQLLAVLVEDEINRNLAKQETEDTDLPEVAKFEVPGLRD